MGLLGKQEKNATELQKGSLQATYSCLLLRAEILQSQGNVIDVSSQILRLPYRPQVTDSSAALPF